MRSIERSSSAAASDRETRSSNRWVWVCDPMSISPVEHASRSADHDTGRPADGTFTPRRKTVLADATGVFGAAERGAFAPLVVELTRLAPVDTQQHVERGKHERTLAVEKTEVAERLEREGVQDREHPAIEEE